MKVLHILPVISKRYGGPASVCKELARELVQQGIEVTILTTHLDYPSGLLNVPVDMPVEMDGVKIYYCSVQFRPLIVSIQMCSLLWREIHTFDILHIHGIYRFPQVFSAWCARRNGIPYIMRPHGSLDPYIFHQKRHKFFKRAYEILFAMPALRQAAAIHFTTDEEQRLTDFLNIADKGVIIPNGLELSKYNTLPDSGNFREKWRLKREDPLILFLGRINFKKGLDLLIPAFARVLEKFSTAKLIIAGPDNDGYKKKVLGWIDQSRIENSVIFTGMLKRNDILSAFVDADFFILPSYSENFGVAVVEAMACGCPVIISKNVNIWQEVYQANAGLVTQCNIDELVDAMLILLRNEQVGRDMGIAGRNLVYNKYNWKQIVSELIEFYKSLASYK